MILFGIKVGETDLVTQKLSKFQGIKSGKDFVMKQVTFLLCLEVYLIKEETSYIKKSVLMKVFYLKK